MKPHGGRQLLDQISATRSRLRYKNRTTELLARLGTIRRSYGELDPQIPELLRYYPIALVACVESYFRLAVKELVDSGSPFLENARDLLPKNGIDFDILLGLHGHAVTIGEVIAHQLHMSNFGRILATMKRLMGLDFPKRIADVQSRWKVEVLGEPKQPIIRNVDETFKWVAEAFELRHVFCHEIATAIDTGPQEIDQCLTHMSLFLEASDELISNTLFPDAPLTQTDMNLSTYRDYERERERLDSAVKAILPILSAKQRASFDEANQAWDAFFKASVDVEALTYEGGSIRPTIANLAGTQLVSDRQAQLARLVDSLQPEG